MRARLATVRLFVACGMPADAAELTAGSLLAGVEGVAQDAVIAAAADQMLAALSSANVADEFRGAIEQTLRDMRGETVQ